ncbi:hypothetical protein CGW93_03755 [candidate division bacterium WOR-3 4484_18]|uniref:ABC-2 type transporter transmembrane domain-containing protein n=1 Tax=candidate division WOR-3 bacterium 4484_18 TaxID=2020626 RepID=A0A257LSY5_UNCW3|nr:MAG: hypothetical protein CGW93_03755 [candidate division bacterium WOR-3 4484_18]
MKRIRIVFQKEVRDLIRDRRTLYSLVVLPLLIYPVFIGGIQKVISRMVMREATTVVDVGIVGKTHAAKLWNYLQAEPLLRWIEVEDTIAPIEDKEVEAIIKIPEGFEVQLDKGVTSEVKIFYTNTRFKSQAAAGRVKDVLDRYRKDYVNKVLQGKGVDTRVLEPFAVTKRDITPKKRAGMFVLGMMVPYVFIIMMMTGAMHTATDITAGEKERGTLETILTAPLTRTELLLGKWLSVLVFALVTGMLAVIGLVVAIKFRLTPMGNIPGTEQMGFYISPGAAGLILVLVVPLATFLASLLITVSIIAKSYREAQTYASIIMMVVIFPAMVSMLPIDLTLRPKIAAIPILNFVLAMKQLIMGEFELHGILMTFGFLCMWAMIMFILAYNVFRREEVLFRL